MLFLDQIVLDKSNLYFIFLSFNLLLSINKSLSIIDQDLNSNFRIY